MFSAFFTVLAAVALFVFTFFMAEELNIRHDVVGIHESWLPVFLPLFVFALSVFVYALYNIVVIRRARRVIEAAQTTVGHLYADDDSADLRVQLADSYIDVFVSVTLLLLLVSVIRALSAMDTNFDHSLAALNWVETLFIVLFLFYVLITVVGAWRTFNNHYFQTKDIDIRKAWCCGTAYAAEKSAADDKLRDQNAHSNVAKMQRYHLREPFQNNKLVFAFTLENTPNKWIDGIQIFLLTLHLIALFVTALLVFARVRQIEYNAAAVSMVPAHTLQYGFRLPERDDVMNVIQSISTWNSKSLSLGVAFVPLFITQGFIVLFTVPHLVAYIAQKRPIVDFIHGAAYFVTFAMLILFEALLAARLDSGVLKDASWHNTFAPLYTVYTFIVLTIGPTLVLSRQPRPLPNMSRWGLVV